jgi:hypothetical protein
MKILLVLCVFIFYTTPEILQQKAYLNSGCVEPYSQGILYKMNYCYNSGSLSMKMNVNATHLIQIVCMSSDCKECRDFATPIILDRCLPAAPNMGVKSK